jgi:hypothetical protein
VQIAHARHDIYFDIHILPLTGIEPPDVSAVALCDLEASMARRRTHVVHQKHAAAAVLFSR